MVRINNLRLGGPTREAGTETPLNVTYDNWLVFPVPPRFLAVGDNLVGICKTGDTGTSVRIEKLELHVRYSKSEPTAGW